MHILQITKYFHPAVSFGGPVQCTYNLSKYLVSRGHKVTVYATDALDISSNARIKGTYHCIDGIEVFYFRNIAKCYGFFISPELIHTLKKNINKFDIVHLHEYRTFQNLVFHFLNRKRVPYVLSCHGEFTYKNNPWDWSFLRKLFERSFGNRLVKDASKLLALTQFEAEQYLASGIDINRIQVIPNGVNPEDFSETFPAGTFKRVFRIKTEEIVLYLGRIHKDKGIDVLVKAFALLSKERRNVKLVLAGPDDGFTGTLKSLVQKLHLEDKVIFTGALNRKQVLLAYSDADIVVYPSIQEGFPIVPLEAGLMGKPVIVSDAPAMDFVEKGKFGLSVKYGSHTDLEKALEMILIDSAISKEFGKNGRAFVLENYSWPIVGKEFESVYNNL